MNKPFYITTTLPYVNAEPHLGHAMEFVRADVITRYKKLQGYDVFFNTGMDEHGTKILEGAVKEGIEVQEYVDRNSARFKELYPKLGITNEINFIRTTEERHIKAAQEMWKRCNDNGYIYKKEYEAKYCVGCELYKTDSELVDDKCPIHSNREIEIIKEENYFFAFSKVESKLRELYEKNPTLVIPDFRFNEIKAFLDRGLEDFSISRLKTKMPWGVPVPGDDEHVMYVWFDALTSYISTLEWPYHVEAGSEGGSDENNFEKYWEQAGAEKREVIQYCGKDNLRQQSAIWQGMLLAAGLPTTTNIIIDGFIISGGQKMSKSIGNVINPFDILEMFKDVTDYPEDVLRFILLHEVPSFEDGDLTVESIKTAYTAYLANGIGNLTSRVMKMATSNDVRSKEKGERSKKEIQNFDINASLKSIMHEVSLIDEYIATNEPFKVIKIDAEKGKEMIEHCLKSLEVVAEDLSAYLPRTSTKILECIRSNAMPEKPLFNRLP